MSTPHKEKLIRVLQLFQTTDEKTPMNAVQVSQKLEEEYGMENVHRTSIYDDVRLLRNPKHIEENIKTISVRFRE